MMVGFSRRRRQLLEAELQRLAQELPPLGIEKLYLTGSLAQGKVGPETELEVVAVQRTDELFHRRPDFFVSHLRPRIGTRFFVYTPEEFTQLSGTDPVLRQALASGELIFGD
jgi:hypothetical protein